MLVRDALGREHDFTEPPQQVVSLVPSITETLFVLGLAEQIVGVTDFCIHPAQALRTKTRVGGTKNPLLERILELNPDLVLANKEENRRRDVEWLEQAGVRVFVTYARTVQEAVEEIHLLARLTRTEDRAQPLLAEIEEEIQEAKSRMSERRPRVVALIWKKPYMAVGGNTFAHDLMLQCGGENHFQNAPRRYPRIDENELVVAEPELILLPTEPFAFAEADRLELMQLDCPAAREGRIHVIEGELLSWYGPRMARALRVLSRLIVS